MRWTGFSRGGASASLLSVAAWLASASPAAAYTMPWDGSLGAEATFGTGGDVRDVVTHGNHTFVANDINLQIYHHIDPKRPVKIGELPIPAQSVAYHAGSGRLAVGDASNVYLIGVGNPAAPAVLDVQPVSGAAMHMDFTDDGQTLVFSIGNQLNLFDVGPSSLANLATTTLPAIITDLDLRGSVAAGGTTLGNTIVDVSNLNVLDDVTGQFESWAFVKDGFFVGAEQAGGLSFYNANDPTQVSFIQTIEPGITFDFVDMVQSGVLVASDPNAAVGRLYDVNDPFAVTPLGMVRFPPSTAAMDASDAGRIVAGAGQGVVSIDAANPNGVPTLGSTGTGAPPTSAVHDPANQLLHVTTQGNLVITFSTTNPTNLTTVGTLPLGTFPLELAKVGNILYVRTFGGLDAYDVTNEAFPVLVKTFTGLSGDIAADGNRLLRARTDIPVVEVFHGADNPLTATSQIISVTGFPQAVDLSGTQLLAAVGPSGVRRVDFTSGVTITTYSAYPFMGDVDYAGDPLVSSTDYATWTNGLRSYYNDLDGGAEVGWTDWHALMTHFNTAGEPGLPRSAGSSPVYLYGTSPQGSIFVLDLTDPSNVSFVGEYTAPGFAPQFTVPADEVVYVGDNSAGGRIVILPAHAAGSVTGAPEVTAPVSPESLLGAAWPNPFAASTQMRFAVPRDTAVDLSVYDVAGRLVHRLASGTFAAGEHVASWDGQDGAGRPAVAGVYFVHLEAGEETATRRIVRLR